MVAHLMPEKVSSHQSSIQPSMVAGKRQSSILSQFTEQVHPYHLVHNEIIIESIYLSLERERVLSLFLKKSSGSIGVESQQSTERIIF
jgi:hypothetical protein